MNVLLTGASGFIGRNIASALIAAGHRIKPVSRSQGIDFSRMLTAECWLPHLQGIDAVINCVGIIAESGSQRFETLHTKAPSALFEACSQVGVSRVLQISALGTDDSAFSTYHLSKRAADDWLRKSPLDWFILRPSLIYGRGGKSAELLMSLARLPLIPVIGGGKQALQPVHINDVVATVLKALTSSNVKQTLDIVGTETITFAEWLQMMRQAQGLSRARLFNVPYLLAKEFSRIGRYFNPILQPENLAMLQVGYWADVQPLIQFLGRKPMRVESHLFFSDITYSRCES